MKALIVKEIKRSFGGVPAVDGVSLVVKPGEITGLIGPNGAGKTTVVNIISGLLAVSSGQVFLEEVDVTKYEAAQLSRAGVARTFQNIRLIGDATVIENVVSGFHRHETTGLVSNLFSLPAARRERRHFESEALGLLIRFGMEDLADHRASSLSYGHQRRVEMMRALAARPAVLLLDEPVAGMNDSEALELASIFEAVAAEGVAILLIEHNMRFVSSLCKKIYVVASGKLIAEGPPHDIFRNPVVVEAYLGSGEHA